MPNGAAAAVGVHPIAKLGFGGAGLSAYEAARPSYPPESIAHCIDALGLRRPGPVCDGNSPAGGPPAAGRPRVLDLAAGTGKLTAQLAALDLFDLSAAEPSAGMCDAFSRACPGVPVVAAEAAALPFEDAAFDAVFVGQAFHCEWGVTFLRASCCLPWHLCCEKVYGCRSRPPLGAPPRNNTARHHARLPLAAPARVLRVCHARGVPGAAARPEAGRRPGAAVEPGGCRAALDEGLPGHLPAVRQAGRRPKLR
jgi:SAM-dependent methyltransferase